MILLDTNICIYVINNRPPAVLARFRQYPLGEIGISSIVAGELTFGVAKSGSLRNRQALEMFLAPLEILPFDERCLRFYETDRTLLTPSSEQVRRPIGTEAVDHWRHFEPWLAPLADSLGAVLSCYPEVPPDLR